ncbi:phosphoesterase [Stappia sp. GBMRC 2046]|uniref:Phosphoesterase n=1 Tax=Stappia sediminis TaxID=2692190 RepID=A0A7X3S8G8_9HYPH|nr:alkaline phosphatase family protein [Stappia sediminis]MXN65807.1 phosphoesterase [Stappia sediminis]
MSPQSADFVVSRKPGTETFGLWRIDPDAGHLLEEVEIDADQKFGDGHRITPVGNYILEWGPSADVANTLVYKLWEFDPTSKTPLGDRPVSAWYWSAQKFTRGRLDFGHFGDRYKRHLDANVMQFVPFGSFVLAWIPNPGRGTFRLWNFDPKSPDPLPEPVCPESSFGLIELGHRLIPLRDYVIDWAPATGAYALWSFDPQGKQPLKQPILQKGIWKDIGEGHDLVPVGDKVLEWEQASRKYRLWQFDPDSPNPLGDRPIASGTLPEAITGETVLTGFQPRHKASTQVAAIPGSLDYMRSKIKHVVYYMVENRSFDHICGWLYSKNDKPAHIIGRNKQPFMGASEEFSNVNDKGEPVHLSLYKHGQLGDDFNLELLPEDPYHENSDVMRQMFFENMEGYEKGETPNMGGFVVNNGYPEVMQTYTPTQVPVLNGLAKHFAISDEWFCSMPGGTDVNRAFSVGGSSLGMLNNFQNGAEYKNWASSTHRPSIWKVLWSNGITDWKIYNSTEWMDFVFTYHLFLRGQIPTVDAEVDAARKAGTTSEYVAPLARFKEDARTGNLPAFSFLEPVWIAKTGTTSYHPGADLVPGERTLNDIYEALKAGPHWNETLLVITFDEHGGIFDHVPPPRARNPWPNDVNDGFHFDIMGVRVPTILVSPMIEEKTLFRSETDTAFCATSFLATLLHWFGIPKARWGLGERTHHAPTFESAIRAVAARSSSPSFTPPYDKDHPANGEMPRTTGVHDLHRSVARRLIETAGRGHLADRDLQMTASAISEGAQTLEELYDNLRRFMRKVA